MSLKVKIHLEFHVNLSLIEKKNSKTELLNGISQNVNNIQFKLVWLETGISMATEVQTPPLPLPSKYQPALIGFPDEARSGTFGVALSQTPQYS